MENLIIVEASNVPIPLDAGLQTEQGERCLMKVAAKALGVKSNCVRNVSVLKRSVDARKKQNVHFVATLAVTLDADRLDVRLPAGEGAADDVADGLLKGLRPAKGVNVKLHQPWPRMDVPCCARVADRSDFVRPMVIGAGPAGLFAALHLAEAGLRPLLLERGECAYDRQKTVDAFASGGPLNPCSNIQFGEGGAGTFSDGKLTTGTKSPHIRHVLQAFVDAGAPEEILWQAKPHIGTDLLPGVVTRLRERIVAAGGEVRFNSLVTQLYFAVDFNGCSGEVLVESEKSVPSKFDGLSRNAFGKSSRVVALDVQDVLTGETERIAADTVILACGHSARDTFTMLQDAGVSLERKPFAMGVRIEHPQKWLDVAQYGQAAGHPALGAADYKLAVHLPKSHAQGDEALDGRGVYTFCMCPGGEVVAAASEEGGVCVNGMSRFARDGRNCNSALLVEVRPDDLPGSDPLEGVRLQRSVEQTAYRAGMEASGVAYAAPAQTVADFLATAEDEGDRSARFATADSEREAVGRVAPTYPRGTAPCDLRNVLPGFMCDAITEAMPLLDRKLRGFANPHAVMTAVEARSSSPVRIVRDAETLESETAAGLYPCGEGAGYAGGIMSAACDGLRVAEAVCRRYLR